MTRSNSNLRLFAKLNPPLRKGTLAMNDDDPPPPRPRLPKPIVLGPEDKPAFPHAPEGYDKVQESIPHGKLQIVEYDSKTVGNRRKNAHIHSSRLLSPQKVSRSLSVARHRWRRGRVAQVWLPGSDFGQPLCREETQADDRRLFQTDEPNRTTGRKATSMRTSKRLKPLNST